MKARTATLPGGERPYQRLQFDGLEGREHSAVQDHGNAEHGGGRGPKPASAGAGDQPGGHGQDHDRRRWTEDRGREVPRPVGHEHAAGKRHHVGEQADRRRFRRDHGPLVSETRHREIAERHEQERNGQQPSAGRLQLPAVMSIKPDKHARENRRGTGRKLQNRVLLEGVPETDHQDHRRPDDQQSAEQDAEQFSHRNLAFFEERVEQLRPSLFGRRRDDRQLRLAGTAGRRGRAGGTGAQRACRRWSERRFGYRRAPRAALGSRPRDGFSAAGRSPHPVRP